MEKQFTFKEVCLLVFLIIAIIAFLETRVDESLLSWIFWKGLILKIFIYMAIAAFVAIFIETTK